MLNQLETVNQKILFNATVFNVNQIPILPPFDKVEEALTQFPIGRVFWETYTILSMFKHVCSKKTDWQTNLSDSLKLLIFKDNLKIEDLIELTTNEFFANILLMSYSNKVEALRNLKEQHQNKDALDIIYQSLDNLMNM